LLTDFLQPMGLFDRLLGSRASEKANQPAPVSKPKQEETTFFLDSDASSSLGNVEFMRRSNRIRRTFPGNADSPGQKELVQEVASMEARLEASTPGLAGESINDDTTVNLTGGVPKPVKKTFAQPMTQAELDQRKKGAAVAVNAPAAAPAAARKASADAGSGQPGSSQPGGKPGDINPFKAMARDLQA
jgi:hypothetical protein